MEKPPTGETNQQTLVSVRKPADGGAGASSSRDPSVKSTTASHGAQQRGIPGKRTPAIHSRMSVKLHRLDNDRWLARGDPAQRFVDVLRPYPAEER